ncbi:MAG: hypothetical protein JRJ02_10845 [Deltaproteobacteria bacterium]|nr:hypothetical protein [Deltaproteobacteria bacterium]
MANDWWHCRKEELLAVAGEECPIYVYNEEVLNETLFDLLAMDAIDGLFYPLHANPHPKILRKAFELDVRFKCVSFNEMTSVFENFPKLAPQQILFVPDHDHGEDFERAFHYGVQVVPGIFKNKEISICIDMCDEQWGSGLIETSVSGLYIRPKINSPPLGDLNETISFLIEASGHFPEISTLILGNDMGVSVNQEKDIMDISVMGEHLEAIKDACPQFRLWLELPAYMVSYAGVLLANGIETGEEEGIHYFRINMDMKAPMYDGLNNCNDSNHRTGQGPWKCDRFRKSPCFC